MAYTLMVSRNLGVSYSAEYKADDQNDPVLIEKIQQAANRRHRYYVDGAPEVMCAQHAVAVTLLGGRPYPTTSMQDKVSRLQRAWRG